jgi:hypothetical protein
MRHDLGEPPVAEAELPGLAGSGFRRNVASALVNTMQQVGGSIGLSALSTVALTATASYLAAHHTGPPAPAIAATHGYTTASAAEPPAPRDRTANAVRSAIPGAYRLQGSLWLSASRMPAWA